MFPTIPGYTLKKRLGGGGSATVFLAEDCKHKRRVALKVLHFHLKRHQREVAGFEKEIKALHKFDHPNIVRIYDDGKTQQEQPFYAMEYLSGGDLGERIRCHGPLAVQVVVRLSVPLLDALAHIHGTGYCHGSDLKIASVLFDAANVPKLTDFSGVESGPDIEPRHDLFRFGTMLYECLIGKTPGAYECDRTIPPCELNPGIPEVLGKVVMELLEEDPARKYQTAADVKAALLTVLYQAE